MAVPSDPDLMLVGSPCHPFSTQRSDRYAASSVEDHHEFGVCFESLVSFLKTVEPRVCISEQVEGFNRPIAKGSTVTPYQRREFLHCVTSD